MRLEFSGKNKINVTSLKEIQLNNLWIKNWEDTGSQECFVYLGKGMSWDEQ